MIHWFLFNFAVVIVALSVIFDINNSIVAALAWILLVIAIILIIKDFLTMRG